MEIPSEPLSPELILVSPPKVAAAAREVLPARALSTTSAAQPPARRSPFRRVAGLAAFYGAALAVTVTPLYFTLQTVPSR